MPVYEYRCEECGRTYEQIRRMSDADKDLACPSCASPKIERLFSAFATKSCSAPAGSRFT
jgi:putative FmdB family regulatory protein